MAGQKRTDNKGRILKDGESQRKDGTYRYRYTDASGVRHDIYSRRLLPTDRMTADCKDDLSLREKERQIQRDLEDNIKTTAENKMTFNELFERSMASKVKLKETSLTTYHKKFNTYIRDGIGKKKITSIKYSDVLSFYNSLLKKGLSPRTLDLVHCVFSSVLTMAVNDDLIRKNPAPLAMEEIKKSHDWEFEEGYALEPEEQAAFLNYVANSNRYKRWLPAFITLLGTGCRVGELTGLQIEDCDFEADIIHINHNLNYCKLKGESRCAFHLTEPKTKKGHRSIPMFPEVKTALLQELETQRSKGFEEYVLDGHSGFIFKGRSGNLLTGGQINTAINHICKSYNEEESARAIAEKRKPLLLPHFSAHTLRHTFCTRLCEQEVNVKVIQEIMGHANIGITMDIYTRISSKKKKDVFTDLKDKIKLL